MRRIFLILFVLLALASAATWYTLQERSAHPQIVWTAGLSPDRVEQVEAFHGWLRANGYVDKDGELVNRWSSQIPTVQADMTDVMALEQINASDFDTAVVAIGDSVEASVITAGNLLDAGISDIWAKSVSKEHARILQRIGARHIINAETDAGKRVGHLVSGNYLDYIELEGAYSVVKIHTPPHVVGYSIEDARVHERFGITVVGVKSPGKEFEYGSKELIMHRNDELIIMGKQNQIDRFLRG